LNGRMRFAGGKGGGAAGGRKRGEGDGELYTPALGKEGPENLVFSILFPLIKS